MKIRSAETTRLLQAVAGGVQVFMGFAGVGDVLPKTVVIFIMAGVGAVQAAIAIWNAGLHTQVTKEEKITDVHSGTMERLPPGRESWRL